MVEVKIKYEIRGKFNKRYVVARENGKIVSKRHISGSKMNKRDFVGVFKKNNTFYENKTIVKLSNITKTEQHTILKSIKPAIKPKSDKVVAAMSKADRKKYKQAILPIHQRKPTIKGGIKGRAMYVVTATFNNKHFSASSKFKGSTAEDGHIFTDSVNARACHDSAWRNLFQQISKSSGVYDADEGLRLMENVGLSNVKEGWISFK